MVAEPSVGLADVGQRCGQDRVAVADRALECRERLVGVLERALVLACGCSHATEAHQRRPARAIYVVRTTELGQQRLEYLARALVFARGQQRLAERLPLA